MLGFGLKIDPFQPSGIPSISSDRKSMCAVEIRQDAKNVANFFLIETIGRFE